MSTATASPQTYEGVHRHLKVTDLRPIFETHIAVGVLKRPLFTENTHDGTPDDIERARSLAAADARFVVNACWTTIAGIKKNRSRTGCHRRHKGWTVGNPCCEDHTLLPQVWHDIAAEAGLPDHRHPSVTTIEALAVALGIHAKELESGPSVAALFAAAGR